MEQAKAALAPNYWLATALRLRLYEKKGRFTRALQELKRSTAINKIPKQLALLGSLRLGDLAFQLRDPILQVVRPLWTQDRRRN